MNQNENQSNEKVTPYKATANLNTAISNPSVDINDTMNINIQTMSTNSSVAETPNLEVNQVQEPNNAKKEKTKKRGITISATPKLKIAILIMVILLVFVFILSIING